jgi:hypothetical protein
MSHAGSWRAACSTTVRVLRFHLEAPSDARGVTDPGVGSGALFGFFLHAMSKRSSVIVISVMGSKPFARLQSVTKINPALRRKFG